MKKLIFLLVVMSVLMLSCSTVRYKTIAVTDNPVGAKIGIVDQKEGGLLEAAKNGGITRIGTATLQIKQYWIVLPPLINAPLVVSEKYEVIVTGE